MTRTTATMALLGGALLLLVPGCEKEKSACEQKCDKLVTCYQETRGALKARQAAVKRCARLCEGKGDAKLQKAVKEFGKLSCLDFMRRHRGEAQAIVKGDGRPAKRRRGARRAAGKGVHPFPALHARPPRDPRKRRKWRSPVLQKVDRILIRKPKETVELKRVEPGTRAGDVGRWKLVRPKEQPADRFAVRNLLNRLQRLRFRGRAEIAPKEYGRHRLGDETGVRCTVYHGDKVLADMIVGRAERSGRKRRGGVTTLVRKAGTQQVWRVAGSLTYLFKRPASGWKDATVIHFRREDIRKLAIVKPDGKLVVKRDPEEKNPRKRFTNWEIVESEPKLESLDQNSITRLVSVLTHLRATNVIKDPKPEKTGLDKPRAEVTLHEKGGKSVTLLIGNKDEKRRSAYGRIKGDDRVFRLRHPLDELPDEPIRSFRDKTLVEAKLNEVVALEVVKNDETVRFEKKGRLWKAVKPEGLKFNQSRLISTIRLLEGRFAAHRFARDAKPEKTGLDKPQGRIIVTVKPTKPDKPERKVEILIGQAGKRGDFYAKVKGKGPVVLIRRWILNRVWRDSKEWNQRRRNRRRRRGRGPDKRRRKKRRPAR